MEKEKGGAGRSMKVNATRTREPECDVGDEET